MHEVLVNRLGGLSLPRKSLVRLTDRPDMTLDVYRGRKTTIQYKQCEMEHMSAIFAQILTGPLASLEETWQHVHKTLKSRLTEDWYVQSWSMVDQFGIPKVYFFKMNLRRFRKEQLDL